MRGGDAHLLTPAARSEIDPEQARRLVNRVLARVADGAETPESAYQLLDMCGVLQIAQQMRTERRKAS